ncbi:MULTISPECIES: cobalt ABC transporter permease [Rhodovulum]|uniref:Nickel transport protein n=1 Tax=Rhodovulum visakhapatnamense TaxID=364297 RepID=A0A4V3GU12_9RHOB|nr:nickel transport protein [Rhodovulum visakhapatnamense]
MIRPLALMLALAMAPLPALAHKVVGGAYADGALIEGEIGFSNGDMAADALVEVFDPAGTRLGGTRTDGDGIFTYRPTAAVAHVFRADLGAGHVAEFTMSAEEVAAILDSPAARAAAETGQAAAPTEADGAAGMAGNPSTFPLGPGPAATAAAAPGLSDADKAAIAKIVRDEMRPLRREIAAYREQNDLQSILGGIGYIAGLFGFGFYIAARRRLKA